MSEHTTMPQAFVAALGELAEIVADETADTGTYRYKYAPLSTIMRAVRPVLAKHDLAVTQLVSSDESKLTIHTVLQHTSGEWYGSGVLAVPLPSTPQQLGSVVSYLRRYQLVALLGIAVEDDDASTAQQAAHAPSQRRGGITDAQRRKMRALLGELGMSGADRRDDVLALVELIVGREITSSNDLSRAEASTVIDELSNRAEEALHGEGYG